LAINDLYTNKHSDINSIHLYFELEDSSLFNEQGLLNYYETLAKVQFINVEIESWLNLESSYTTDQINEKYFCKNKYNELIPSYIEGLRSIIVMLDNDNTGTRGLIKKIKDQLKQYN
jgi:hypothetical protein